MAQSGLENCLDQFHDPAASAYPYPPSLHPSSLSGVYTLMKVKYDVGGYHNQI